MKQIWIPSLDPDKILYEVYKFWYIFRRYVCYNLMIISDTDFMRIFL